MKIIADIRPEIAAFSSGALVMIFEILGSRILGSYVGTSLFVWTNVIALILWSLAAWYYYGWKIADRWAWLKTLSFLFLFCGFLFLSLPFIKDAVLVFITSIFTDVRFSSFFATLTLFVPVSFFLGMIQPIATKLRIKNLESTGSVIGRVGSIGTLWSILGTLAAGFFLIPFFGIINLLISLAFISFILSCIYDKRSFFIANIIWILLCISTLWLEYFSTQENTKNGVHFSETPYSHVTIKDDIINGQNVRNLFIDNVTHAGKYLESDELLYDYTKAYDLFHTFLPNAKEVVMFWGAAYSYPQSFIKTYPDKNIDVVEIDKDLTDLARQYFGLWEYKNMTIFHEDARVFLRNNTKKYDAILGDAFGSYFSIPYQLTTLETAKEKYNTLYDNGVVILNIIGSMTWEKARFVEAEYHTYQQVFPEVFIIPVRTPDTSQVQNIILIALKNPDKISYTTENPVMQEFLENIRFLDIPKDTPILTDNYAPVEYLISQLTK